MNADCCTGAPVAYKLMPAATPPMYAHPSSSHGRRGIFAAKHLWVTPHSEEERWPAGMFPLQGPGEYARGILDWTRQVCLSCFVAVALQLFSRL